VLDVFARLRVVPLKDVYVHEGVVERWVERIADFIRHDGIMKNPIIVAEAEVDGNRNYIVLDGMHRVQAFHTLGSPDILVYISDYWSEDVRLESWDAVLLDAADLDTVIAAVAGEKIEVVPVGSEPEARARVYGRELAMAMISRDGRTLGLRVVPDAIVAIAQ
jgi:hypothetical protein